MGGVHHQYLLIKSGDEVEEVFNGARTAAYLADPALRVNGISPCDILDFGGCETYRYYPYNQSEAWADFPGSAGNFLTAPAFQLHHVFAGDGTGPLTVADTGQTWDKWGVNGFFPSIVANKLDTATGFAGPGNAAWYADAELDGQILLCGGRFPISAGSTGGANGIALLAWNISPSAFFPGSLPFNASIHVVITEVGWQYFVYEASVGTILASDTYIGGPLAPGSYEAWVTVDPDTSTAVIHLPDGTDSPPISDPRIMSLSCTHAGFEYLGTAATDRKFAFTEVWADTRATFNVPEDLTVIAVATPSDYTPATAKAIASVWTANEASWIFYLDPTGLLVAVTSADGLFAGAFAASTVPLPTNALGMSFTFVGDNGAGGNEFRFEWSIDGFTFEQLGATVTNVGTAVLFGGNSDLGIGYAGAFPGVNPFDGEYAYLSVRRGTGPGGTIGGVEVFTYDADDDLIDISPTALEFDASTGQVINVHHSGSPALTLVPPGAIIGEYCADSWMALTYDTPATDPAPWYNENYPESADALGFYITDWTGLGEGHVGRPSTRIGSGGVRLGPSTADGRVMKLNIILIARTEEAMIYLFDWLGATLNGICGGCADESIFVRRSCGDPDDPAKGFGEMRRVGVADGLEWLSDLVPRGSCVLRAASVTLTAGDPCVYLVDQAIEVAALDQTAVLDTCFDAGTVNTTRRPCRPSCIEQDDACRTVVSWEANPMAAMGPVISMTNESNEHTVPFRAIVYADPLEIGHEPNPCGLAILGEIYVRPLPGWSDMVWDVTGRTVLYRDVTTGVLVEGSAYLDENDPPNPRFFNLGCGMFHLVLEPADFCGDWDGSELIQRGFEFDDPHLPAVSVRLQERVGCGG